MTPIDHADAFILGCLFAFIATVSGQCLTSAIGWYWFTCSYLITGAVSVVITLGCAIRYAWISRAIERMSVDQALTFDMRRSARLGNLVGAVLGTVCALYIAVYEGWWEL